MIEGLPPIAAAPSAPDPLRQKATQLEAFLFEALLRVSGTSSPNPFGGSDSQFESFLQRSQAEAVAASGQSGLSEAIYQALLRTEAIQSDRRG